MRTKILALGLFMAVCVTANENTDIIAETSNYMKTLSIDGSNISRISDIFDASILENGQFFFSSLPIEGSTNFWNVIEWKNPSNKVDRFTTSLKCLTRSDEPELVHFEFELKSTRIPLITNPYLNIMTNHKMSGETKLKKNGKMPVMESNGWILYSNNEKAVFQQHTDSQTNITYTVKLPLAEDLQHERAQSVKWIMRIKAD